MLRKRSLSAPDRRPLYAYRLDTGEFQSLELLLKNNLAQFRKEAYRLGYGNEVGLGLVSGHISGFAALFVLYAAEWWRQRYDGSGWSWQPILRDIDAGPEDWSAPERSACVAKGLQDWGLSLRGSGGLRYLGEVALQGGLPMRLLAEAKGGVGDLLRAVLKEAARSKVTVHDIQVWVQSLEKHLPRTYRQLEIHLLLAQVVDSALRLKEEAKLTRGEDAIAQLELLTPSWRERFPLPLNDTNARGLIEQLIRDASSVRIERQAALFRVERFLERDPDGLWHLHSKLILPDTNNIESAQLGMLFGEDYEVLPRLLDVTLMAAGESQTFSLRRLVGHDKYHFNRRPYCVSNGKAADEHVLRLSSKDGRMWNSTAPGGDELNDNLPWVFDARGESPSFLKQGAGSVSTHEALVAVPMDWVVDTETDSACILEGRVQHPEKQLFRVRGTVHFADSRCETYRIRTGRAESNQENYRWVGRRVWERFVQPGMAFIGRPRLYRVSEDGGSQFLEEKYSSQMLGARSINTLHLLGPLEMRYPVTGEVKHRARMVILPINANFRLEFNDATSGCICFQNWGAIGACVTSGNAISETSQVGDNLVISLRVAPEQRAPEWVELNVYWPGTPVAARLRLPYPAKGARIYDSFGNEFQSDTLVAAKQLFGMRIQALGGDPTCMPRMTLELRLNRNGRALSHNIFPPGNSAQVEIRLQDYAEEIAHLLANDDAPDAAVEAILQIAGKKSAMLHIARYACRMQREDSNDHVYLDKTAIERVQLDNLNALQVMALRLQAPEEEAVRLAPVMSEGVTDGGAWKFAPETREPGSWLIFPASKASLQFRPLLWTVSGDVTAHGPVAQSVGISRKTEREPALNAAIETMAADFLDPGWADMERLAAQIGHLPLATLDLWRRFARSANGMAALALRFHMLPDNFLNRFSQELPFSWETVPYASWRKAMERLKQQCDAEYEMSGELIFKVHIESCLAKLSSNHPALTNVLRFSYSAMVGDIRAEIRAFRHPNALGLLNDILFSGDQSLLQRLLRNNADAGNSTAHWPTTLNRWAREAQRSSSLSSSLLCSINDYREGLINVPILLATQVATNDTKKWFETSEMVYDLRSHIAFDPDWFTEAYNLTIARCLSSGLLKLEVES